MIRFLRKKGNQKRIMLGVAIILTLCFALWGIPMSGTGEDVSAVAGWLGKKKISTGDFIKNYKALRTELTVLGHLQDPNRAALLDLERLTWDRMLLLREAKKRRVRVTDEEVVTWIADHPAFYRNGVFNRPLYEYFVERQLRMTARGFEENIREFLTVQKTRQAISEAESLTDARLREALEERFSSRDLRYILLTESDLDASPTVEPEKLDRLYTSLRAILRSPERFRLRYLNLDSSSSVNTDETRSRIRSEGLDSASEFGLSAVETAWFSLNEPIPEIGFSQELQEAISRLKAKGSLTNWIEFQDHHYLFELVEKEPSRQLSLEEARPQLEGILMKQAAQDLLSDKAQELRDRMIEDGFVEVQTERDFPLYEATDYRRGEYLEKLGEIPTFDRDVAPLSENEISLPLRTAAGVALVQVLRRGEPDEASWDGEKENLRKELERKAKRQRLETFMSERYAELRANAETMRALFPEKYETEDL